MPNIVNSRIHHQPRRERGSTLVEFALVAFQFLIVLFACFEFCRMIIVYNTVANAAKVGARYAITHGKSRETTPPAPPATGPDGPSGPGGASEVIKVVENYSSSGLLSVSNLNTQVTYLLPPTLGDAPCTGSACNSPGYRVRVHVSYPYKPWVLLPLNVTLRSISTGVITY